MDAISTMNMVVLPQEEWQRIIAGQKKILEHLETNNNSSKQSLAADYIPASEFMKAVNIKRTKFYDLIMNNKIKTIKKARRIYVLRSELKRYFIDPNIR